MKIVIISDLHLTDSFDATFAYYIANVLKTADQVIINGDFWDAYVCTFDDFVQSEWKTIFPLLLSKKCIYLYGNHDARKCMDSRDTLFSVEQKSIHSIVNGQQTIEIQHGHEIAPAADKHWLFRQVAFIRPLYRVFFQLKNYSTTFDRLVKRLYQDAKDAEEFESIKKYASTSRRRNKRYVFGHSHVYAHGDMGVYSCSLHSDAGFSYVVVDNGKISTACLLIQ